MRECAAVIAMFTPAPSGFFSVRLLSAAVLLACLLAAGSALARNSAPRLWSDSEIASAGFFRLAWETDAERVELQESTDPDFNSPATAYAGPDRATVISGKPDGKRYYRVRALSNSHTSPWSETVAVVVAHHSLSRALMFLSLGIIVFIAIVAMIVRGSRKPA